MEVENGPLEDDYKQMVFHFHVSSRESTPRKNHIDPPKPVVRRSSMGHVSGGVLPAFHRETQSMTSPLGHFFMRLH